MTAAQWDHLGRSLEVVLSAEPQSIVHNAAAVITDGMQQGLLKDTSRSPAWMIQLKHNGYMFQEQRFVFQKPFRATTPLLKI